MPASTISTVPGEWVVVHTPAPAALGVGTTAAATSRCNPTHPAGRGAILLTPDCSKCLLVRGYKRDAGWGFPRGKLSKGETDAECAMREVRPTLASLRATLFFPGSW